MRITRRRSRISDSLANPEAVVHVFELLRMRLPSIIPPMNKELRRMLNSVRHINSYPVTDNSRGRPLRYPRQDLLKVSSALNAILKKEARSISIKTFVDHYIPILDYPEDVKSSLASGQINLFEAAQLARLTPEALNLTWQEVRRKRQALLKVHVESQESGPKLKTRIDQVLGKISNEQLYQAGRSSSKRRIGTLKSVDVATHLFSEQLQQIANSLAEIKPDDLSPEDMVDILNAGDKWWLTILRAKKRRRKT
jgi:hypothetical protein